MVNEIDRKLNTYFINKETGKIFFNNVMFGNIRNVGTGCAVVFPLELSVDNLSRNAGVDIDPNDYHVVLGAVIEIIGIIEARAEHIELAIDAAAIRDGILIKFTKELTRLQYRAIKEHYVGMGDIDG